MKILQFVVVALASLVLCACSAESDTLGGATIVEQGNWLDGAPAATQLKNGGYFVSLIKPLNGLEDNPLATPYHFGRSFVEFARIEDSVVQQVRLREARLFEQSVTTKSLADAALQSVESVSKNCNPPLTEFETEYLLILGVAELIRRNSERSFEFGQVNNGAFSGNKKVADSLASWSKGSSDPMYGKVAGKNNDSDLTLCEILRETAKSLGIKGWVQGAAVSNFVTGNIGAKFGPEDSRRALGVRLEGVRPVVSDPYSVTYMSPINVIEFADGSLGYISLGLSREVLWTFANGDPSREPPYRVHVDLVLPKCQWELERFFSLVLPMESTKPMSSRIPVKIIAGDDQGNTKRITSASFTEWQKLQEQRLHLDRELISSYLALEEKVRAR